MKEFVEIIEIKLSIDKWHFLFSKI